jgi:hypothetical protein
MTRRDYKLIARALYQSKPSDISGRIIYLQWEKTRNAICQALAADNPRFDPVKFLSACNGD